MKEIERKIHALDATDQPVGRLATRIAIILRGKNKASFLPNVDGGDFVDVTNCSKLKFTGKKMQQKEYKWHTNHPGGLKSKKAGDVMKTDAGDVLRRAVWGMLPKNKLRDKMIKRLKTTN